MLLPIFITPHYISALLVEEETIEVKQSAFYKFPYNLNKFDSLTPKKLDELIGGLLKGFSPEHRKIIVTAKGSAGLAVESNYEYKALRNFFPFPVILIDQYENDFESSLDSSELNKYLNSKHYAQNVSPEIRLKLTLQQIEARLNSNIGDFLDIHTVALLTPGVEGLEKSSYLKSIVQKFADTITINGYWNFSLDDQVGMIPLSAALAEQSIDPKEYFGEQDLPSNIKLIVTSGVESLELTREDAETETIDLVQEELNKLEIKPDEKVKLKWKTRKTKFDGELYGSEMGIFIDTRDRKELNA